MSELGARRRICGIGDEAAADLDGQLKAHRDANMRGIELRTVNGLAIHQFTHRQVQASAEAVADAGLVVPVIDSPIGGWAVNVGADMNEELRLLRCIADRATAFGCRRVRIMSYPNDGRPEAEWRTEALRRMRLLTAAAADLDVVLLHENCQGWASGAPSRTVEMLQHVDSPHLRLVFDVGNGLAYGYDAAAFLREVLPWVEHVHVKDGLRAGNVKEPLFTMPGAGDAGLAPCIDMLERHGYQGWYSIEPHLAYRPHQQFESAPEDRRDLYQAYAAAFGTLLTTIVDQLGHETTGPDGGTSDTASPSRHRDRAPVRLGEEDLAWLSRLLSVPSVSPFEGGDPHQVAEAQRVFADGALARGFDRLFYDSPRLDEVVGPQLPLSVRARLDDPGFLSAQPSLIVGLGRAQPEHRRLVLNFHVDTVGPHVPPSWDGSMLRGRGTVDDKGPGVAATVGVAAAFAAEPSLQDEIQVLVASVPGEEGGAMGVYGTRWLVGRGYTGRLMIFAEPTGCEVYDASSATMTARLSVVGDDSTDDFPDRGHNATVALALLTDLLTAEVLPLAERLGAKACIGGLHTGISHNRVYGTGQLLINIAYLSLSDADALVAAVAGTVERSAGVARRRYAGTRSLTRLLEDWPAVVRLDWLKRGLPPLDNRNEAMEAVLASAGLPRRDAVAAGLAFTCDAIWAGGHGRYVAACGPGSLDGCRAHTTDEHVDRNELDRYATAVRDLILSFAAHVRRSEGNVA